ncbi:amidohydrolase 2 [Hortaea werneckii]|uniref:Amidohydrolase-related domain-containing protein n=2 Tax=Hortaea werneckii TaxID=91943 RepID=A0A3M7JBG1_HORWE|nr:amidohydrolase 2 [Hortaea werneckii]OTA18616.1 hypothetical protein BTJ68_14994 [Hortaea werneckii EXF-2000]KAI6826440.1 amidohydrolase 2 [Hortaea werneckii]KAI6923435.1 amidohydrolase 2 [Hortaea werneckii]KAI6932485.1 amidohydrolase 2 [Hortaea werneckii]
MRGLPVAAARSMSSHTNGHSKELSQLAARIPKGTWDTHMHVVDPTAFPLSKDAQYKASPHTIQDATAFLHPLGIRKMVIVQPSIYGNDNSCTLDGLERLGLENGRAVIQFDPASTTSTQLQKWHALGARGVRLNFKSVGAQLSSDFLSKTIHAYADAIRHLDWVLELYIPLEDVPLLEPIVPELGNVRICIDHFGHPSPSSLSSAKTVFDVPGFTALTRLLQAGHTWVKVSGSYRLDMDPRHPIVESLCRETLRLRADRCVFATDWPHTRFDGLDVKPYLEAMLDWIEAEGIPLEKVLVHNAEELFNARR